jgi:hypothetical protein
MSPLRWRQVLARECSFGSEPEAAWESKSQRRWAERAAVSGSRSEQDLDEQAARSSARVRRRDSPEPAMWATAGSGRGWDLAREEEASEASEPQSARAFSRESAWERELGEPQWERGLSPRSAQSARVSSRRSVWERETDEQEERA